MHRESSMKSKLPLRGVVVSLNTPFDDFGRIDFPSVALLVERHLQEGAAGFLAPAQAGEVNTLSMAERTDLTRFLREKIGSRALFLAGATAAEIRDSFLAAEQALASGCEAILVEVPSQLRNNRKQVLQFFREFAAMGMPLLMIQDLDWDGFGLDVDVVVELFEEIEAFRSLKVEVRPAGPKYSRVIEATGGKLHVCGGWASDQMIEALDRGVDVIMPTAMTAVFRLIFDLHTAGRREEAAQWFRSILPILAFTRQHLDISIQFYKRLFCHYQIFSSSRVRKNCIPYDRHHEAYGVELIQYLDELNPFTVSEN
jgi:dihydrodipicolinate synthase/N-acetylneuraminate lyase